MDALSFISQMFDYLKRDKDMKILALLALLPMSGLAVADSPMPIKEFLSQVRKEFVEMKNRVREQLTLILETIAI